jgi:hypothetical protein
MLRPYVCTKTTAFGKEIYETPSSEHKVKDAMKTMQEDLDNLEDAVLKDDFDLAVRLANEIDEANHYVCNLDLSRTELYARLWTQTVRIWYWKNLTN